MRFSIKAKLAGGFGAVLLLTAAAGGVGYQKLMSSEESMKFVISRAELQALVLDAKGHAINGVSNVRAAVISTDDAQMTEFSKRAADNRNDAVAGLAKAKATSSRMRQAAAG